MTFAAYPAARAAVLLLLAGGQGAEAQEVTNQEATAQEATAPARLPADPDAPVAVRAAEIVVTGRGLPDTPAAPAYGTVTVPRETVLALPSGRIEEALGAVAGVQQFRRSDSRSANPTAQGLSLRALGGNASSRALVTLDGVPIADPFFGSVPFAQLVPETIGEIAVTRGGGTGPFGSGALAGSVALRSADPDTLAGGLAEALVNDRGDTEAVAAGSARLGAGWLTGAVRWDRGPGFQTTPAEQRVVQSVPARFDAWSAQLRAVTPVGAEWTGQARLALFDDRRTLRFEGADSRSRGADASIRLTRGGRWQAEALAYLQARDFSNVTVSATRFVPVLDQRRTPSLGWGGKAELRPPVGGGHVVRLGADYRDAGGRVDEIALSAVTGQPTERRRAGGTVRTLGLFAEDDWQLGALLLTGGVRAERAWIVDGRFDRFSPDGSVREAVAYPDRSAWQVTGRAGVLLRASRGLDLRAAAYTGLRQPTPNELYRPFVIFPVTTLANAALRPERLRGIEGGANWRPAPGLALSLTAFHNDLRDAIANVTIGPDLRERQNLPGIRAQGLEASLTWDPGPWSIAASTALTDARLRNSGRGADGEQPLRPAQSPRVAAALSAAWQGPGGVRLGATLRHIGAQFEDDRNLDRLPAATTLGLFAQVPLSPEVDLVLRGENVTDARIVTRNAGGSVDLGTPPTLWAGLRWNYR